MCQPVFAHSQGYNQPPFGPVEGDGAAKLGGHAPVHELLPKPWAKVDDPATWASYPEAVEALRKGHGTHLGFILTDTIFAALDCDRRRDPFSDAVDF